MLIRSTADTMKILLVCKGEYRYFFPEIAEALTGKHGAQVSAVAFASTTALMLEQSGTFQRVFNLAEWLRAEHQNLEGCLRALSQFESSHQVRVNTMIHTDRILRDYAEEDAIKILAGGMRFWREICRTCAPDAIIGEVACATEWIGWLVAHSRAIPYFIPYPTPVANRFFFIDKPEGTWRKMELAFLAAKARSLNAEESNAAENFIRSFRTKKTKPPFLEWAQHSPLSPQMSRFARRIRRIPFRIRTHFADGKYEVGSYHGTSPWRPIGEDAARIARHIVSEVRMFERRVDHSKRNVYFPLHVQPEFTTDVRAPFYANQIALIENISKSIPVGYTLLIKEHPGMRGERVLRDYKTLKNLRNVQLLSPRVDSHDLIRNSDAILTITGTSAWEAILYERPTIAFGPLCYGFSELAYRCENIADLPGLLSQALERFAPKHDLLLKFVWAFLDSAYQLEWGDPIRQPRIADRHNCEKIADAIVSELSGTHANREAEVTVCG